MLAIEMGADAIDMGKNHPPAPDYEIDQRVNW
jgi:hypothetical protein